MCVRFISINDHYDSLDYKGTTGGLDVVLCYRSGKDAPEYIRLEELIQTLNNTEERIIFAVSTISNTPRVDNYIGIERYYKCTKEGEWLFIPVENSSFLSLEENSIQGGYTILDYISIIAKKHGISVKKDIEEKRLQNIFGEQCSVLKIGFMTE